MDSASNTVTLAEALVEKKPIPRDEKTLRKIAYAIRAQFNIEILIKQREIKLINEELRKAVETRETLRACILDDYSLRRTVKTPTSPYSSEIPQKRALQTTYIPPPQTMSQIQTRHSTRRTSSTRDSNYLYYDSCRDLYARRNDGTFVKLACPKCRSSKFVNVQGFLNHCRLAHKIEFPNHDEAVLVCGIPVDENVIPPNHPARSQQITRPPSLRTILGDSGATRTSKRPKIKVFEEDVDLGVDDISDRHSGAFVISPIEQSSFDASQKVYSGKGRPQVNEPSSLENCSSPAESNISGSCTPLHQPFSSYTLPVSKLKLATSKMLSPTTSDYSSDSGSDDDSSIDISHEKALTQQSGQLNGNGNGVIDTITKIDILHSKGGNEQNIKSGNEDVQGSTAETDNGDPMDIESNAESDKFYGRDAMDIDSKHAKTSQRSVTPETNLPAAVNNEKQTASMDGSRFYLKRRIIVGNISKWIPPDKRHQKLKDYTHQWMIYVVGPPNASNVSSFIRKVRFTLHQSYKPYHIVDVVEPPFQLSRLGWGEFPVRIQLFFVDKRNKPVELVHSLKLDYSNTGKQKVGEERRFDLELDRDTTFVELRPEVIGSDIKRAKSGVNYKNDYSSATTSQTDALQSAKVDTKNTSELENAVVRTVTVDEPAKNNSKTSFDNNLPKSPLTMSSTILPSETSSVPPQNVTALASNETIQIKYCRFCGCPVNWHESTSANIILATYKCKHRPACLRYKNSRLSSMASAREALGTFLETTHEDDDMEIDVGSSIHVSDSDNRASSSTILQSDDTNDLLNNSQFINSLDPEGIDWIWDVVDQIKLPTVSATRLNVNEDQMPMNERRVATEQRLIVGNLIFQATKNFVKDIINKSLEIYKSELADDPLPKSRLSCKDREDMQTTKLTNPDQLHEGAKMLVPYHLYRTFVNNLDSFDFLTNAMMGETVEEDAQKEAG
ncbi:3242_t:CDS:10 [Paraglomus occultum]|uniref:3242_t:CDS:1 n=1 Tax=Paraglomus occultum TaxID=144539 RepID=A0A9N9APT2_9GLOM|nr:3242_t:CDS:10 [Paraglomus occultum]